MRVSIVGVLISSIIAKRIDYKRSRQEYLAKKREEPYGQFVDMIYKIQQNAKKPNSYTEAQMLADLSVFSKQITLWGSSKVVRKWVQFREPRFGSKKSFNIRRHYERNEKGFRIKAYKKRKSSCFLCE